MTQAQLKFSQLKLIDPLLEALRTEGYEIPTPIQQQAIPPILEERDLLGVAQTGTGKTAAFAIPMLQLLASRSPKTGGARHPIRALILTPTRELAAQIAESFDRYGANLKISNTVIFGGVGQGSQVSALRKGVDVLVATPGRLLDLMEQRFVDLSHLEIFVLDEADRMLDMGFIHDVKRVIKVLPKSRHSLFFSATMPPDIQRLADQILTNPAKVAVTPVASTAEKVTQEIYFVDQGQKRELLEHIMKDDKIKMALVFTRTKHGADRVARFLNQGGVPAEAIHGNKSQNNRVRALNNFKEGGIRVLVATDIAARGIDIEGVTHVINFELPNIPESYVHRIGRTARAGAEGSALSFCAADERPYLKDIERLIGLKVPVTPTPALAPARPRAAIPAGRTNDSRGSSRPSHSGGRMRGNRPPEGYRAPAPREAAPFPATRSSAPRDPAVREARESAPRESTPNSAPRTAHGRGGSRPHSGGNSRQATRDPRGNSGRPQQAAGGQRSAAGGPRSGPSRPSSAHRKGSSSQGNRPNDRRDTRGTSAKRPSEAPQRDGNKEAQPWWKKLLGKKDSKE